MRRTIGFLVLFTLFVPVSFAADIATGFGRIIETQGHVVPNCRTVVHRENATGVIRQFRIQDVAGDDDVQALVLAAMIAGRDVIITYDPAWTTGCGPEPRIQYVQVR